MRSYSRHDKFNVVPKHDETSKTWAIQVSSSRSSTETPSLVVMPVQSTVFTRSEALLHLTASSRNAAPLAERGLPASAGTEPNAVMTTDTLSAKALLAMALFEPMQCFTSTPALFTLKDYLFSTSDKSALLDAAPHPNFVEHRAHAAVEL